LVPAAPAKAFFVETIASLAARFHAVVFEPHVTIHVTEDSLEDPAIMLRRAFPKCSPYRLKVRNIDSSDEFTKTVFVQFESDKRLTHLNTKLRRVSPRGGEYQLNPHLSLIYRKMDGERKRKIAKSIRLPFTEVVFDCAKAVVSPAEITSREDVEQWRVIAECSLTA
jgi:hypothetical protein